MSTADLKSSEVLEELVRALPPHLRQNLDEVDRQLIEAYGKSPGVTNLLRMWIACGTPFQLRSEFERAVLDIKRRDLRPDENGDYNEDCL